MEAPLTGLYNGVFPLTTLGDGGDDLAGLVSDGPGSVAMAFTTEFWFRNLRILENGRRLVDFCKLVENDNLRCKGSTPQ